MSRHEDEITPLQIIIGVSLLVTVIVGGTMLIRAGVNGAIKFYHKPTMVTSDEVEDDRLAEVATAKEHDEQIKKLEAMQITRSIDDGTWCEVTSGYLSPDGTVHAGSKNCQKLRGISTSKKESITPRGYLEQQINEKAAGDREIRAFETYYELRDKYFEQEVDRRCDCKEKNAE